MVDTISNIPTGRHHGRFKLLKILPAVAVCYCGTLSAAPEKIVCNMTLAIGAKISRDIVFDKDSNQLSVDYVPMANVNITATSVSGSYPNSIGDVVTPALIVGRTIYIDRLTGDINVKSRNGSLVETGLCASSANRKF